MTPRTLIRRSLRFHIRSHFGVVLGAAIGSAALIGALVVGDSVRQTLLERALERLGRIHLAAFTQDRFFDPGLLERMRRDSSSSYTFDLANPAFPSPSGAGLMLSAVVSRQDGTARANHVTAIGVERSVWPGLANWSETQRWTAGETAFVNEAVARQLGANAGEGIVVRVRKPH